MQWTPAAILPNLRAAQAIEGEVVAFAPCDDPRVREICAARRVFKDLISRFTDAFGRPLEPLIQIVREDVAKRLAHVEPLASFRDLVASSVIPYARARRVVYEHSSGISYSDSFWLYPWTLATDYVHLVRSTPAAKGFHVVDDFRGQSSPEVSIMELESANLDQSLFDALLNRWTRHYLGTEDVWEDRALFRSLNMANEAAKIPAGVDSTVYDFGRIVALWVSAFEILSRPETEQANVKTVYRLLDRAKHLNSDLDKQTYDVGTPQKPQSRSLSCWLYKQLYELRNNFLHGNPIGHQAFNPNGLTIDLHWIAPVLYRLALTGFLDLSFDGPNPARMKFEQPQRDIERALLKARK